MQKLYYSISEICEIVDEEQHILRYWEKEFELLNPKKNRAGNRIYSDRDLFVIKTIKYMLRGEKLSLKGVKEQLNKMLSAPGGIESFMNTDVTNFSLPHPASQHLQVVPKEPAGQNLSREEILEIYQILKDAHDLL